MGAVLTGGALYCSQAVFLITPKSAITKQINIQQEQLMMDC
jgi:hypothetical protein